SIYSKYDLISVNSLTVTGINNREIENYKCKQLNRKCTYPNYIYIGNDNYENCFSNKDLPLTLCTVINNKYQCQRVNVKTYIIAGVVAVLILIFLCLLCFCTFKAGNPEDAAITTFSSIFCCCCFCYEYK
ncbi:hypothetical protein U3516DRAFT_789914, partial [Neocallimastix sp. 'constans']